MLEAFSFDQYFFSAIHNQLPGFYWFFYVVTNLGSPFAVTLATSLAFLLGKNKIKVFAAILLIGLLFSLLITEDVKDIVQSARPPGAYSTNVLHMTSYSFPSGHALSIFLAASILGAYYGWKYRIAGYAIALIVSLSRVYLSVHYPTDIIGGALIGTLIGEMLIFAAYEYGLCDSMGLLSLIYKPYELQKPNNLQKKIHENKSLLYVIAFLGAILTTILFSSGYSTSIILVLAVVTFLIIILTLRSSIPFEKKLLYAYIIMSIGLTSAFSIYFLNGYMLSLAVIAITYIAGLALAKTEKATGH